MFPLSTTPIIRTQNCNHSLWYWSYFLCSYLPPTWPSLATLEGDSCTKVWPVPEAVVTVLCTPDDGCVWHPKHVEWTCRIINRRFCVASLCLFISFHLFNSIVPHGDKLCKFPVHSFIHRIDYGQPVTTTQNEWKKLRENRILCYTLIDYLIIT